MKKNVKLGIFVIAGLLIFVAALYYLGSKNNIFGSQILVSADFQNASGIQSGSNIRLAGVKIGNVENVSINSDSSVTITMLIDRGSAQFVKKDAQVSIGSEGLMGNKVINISDGSADVGSIEEGDMLKAKIQADFDNIMRSVLSNSQNLEDITNNLVAVTERLMKGEGAVGTLLFDTAIENKMNNVIISLEKTGNNTVSLTSQLKGIASDLTEGKGMAGKLLSDEETSMQFDIMMDSIQRIAEEAGVIANRLAEFSDLLNNGRGSINRLITDTIMADNLEATILNAKLRSEELEETINTVNNSWLLNLFSGSRKNKKNEDKKGQRSSTESAKIP